MNRRARTRLCIWLIFIGLLNFLAYTCSYAYIKGDAANGRIANGHYFVRGHFIDTGEGQEHEVRRGIWIYSYAHSISIWPTVAWVLLAMLVLARPLIHAAYPPGGFISGSALIATIATLVIVVTGILTAFFTIDFIRSLVSNHGSR